MLLVNCATLTSLHQLTQQRVNRAMTLPTDPIETSYLRLSQSRAFSVSLSVVVVGFHCAAPHQEIRVTKVPTYIQGRSKNPFMACLLKIRSKINLQILIRFNQARPVSTFCRKNHLKLASLCSSSKTKNMRFSRN